MTKFLLLFSCFLFNELYTSEPEKDAFNKKVSQQLWEICRNPCVDEENSVGKELQNRFGEEYDIHQEEVIINQKIFDEHKDFLINNPFVLCLVPSF